MSNPNPEALIEQVCGDDRVPDKSYHRRLPDELAPWYVYTEDGGHSLLCALGQFYRPGAKPEDFLVTVPVLTVQRGGYEMRDGYILVNLPYNQTRGLLYPSTDEEF